MQRSLLVEYFDRFSSWQKIVRAIAIWLKLKGLLGKRTMQKDVKVGDRYQAETEIIKVIQQERLSLRQDIYWHARSISNVIISACTDGTIFRSRQANQRQRVRTIFYRWSHHEKIDGRRGLALNPRCTKCQKDAFDVDAYRLQPQRWLERQAVIPTG